MSISHPQEQALRLASFLLDEARALPEPLLARARDHVFDYFAVTLAGLDHPTTKTLRQLVLGENGSMCVLNGVRELEDATDLRDAIFVATVASHIYDFDDDEPVVSIAHNTAPVMSAVWVLGARLGIDGETALRAYSAGVSCMIRIGALINPSHYQHGWHASATLAAFGTATACAYLQGCSPETLALALQFCATSASGIRTSFGSDAKSMQVARSAEYGYRALQYAQAGLTASTDNLFGPAGFVDIYRGDAPVKVQDTLALSEVHPLESPGLTIKRYPCCTSNHTAIDAIRHLQETFGVQAAQVERIDVQVGSDIPHILIYDTPTSPLEGKFCLKFNIAAAVLHGDVDLDTFTQTVIDDPEIAEMMKKIVITVKTDETVTDKLDDDVSLRVHFNGQSQDCFFKHASGSPQKPLDDHALQAKFTSCVGELIAPASQFVLIPRLRKIDTQSLDTLFRF